MTHHLVLWGGFRLEPSRLLAVLSNPPANASSSLRQERTASELIRLERCPQHPGVLVRRLQTIKLSSPKKSRHPTQQIP